MDKTMILKILGMLGGRKFIVTIVTSAIIAFLPGIDSTLAMTLAGLAASFILGQSYADGMSDGTTSTTKAASTP